MKNQEKNEYLKKMIYWVKGFNKLLLEYWNIIFCHGINPSWKIKEPELIYKYKKITNF